MTKEKIIIPPKFDKRINLFYKDFNEEKCFPYLNEEECINLSEFMRRILRYCVDDKLIKIPRDSFFLYEQASGLKERLQHFASWYQNHLVADYRHLKDLSEFIIYNYYE